MLPYFYKSQIACEYADNVISYRMSSFIHSCTKVSYRWKAFRKSHKYLTGTIKLIQLKMHLRILYYKAIHYLKQHSKISGTLRINPYFLWMVPLPFHFFQTLTFVSRAPYLQDQFKTMCVNLYLHTVLYYIAYYSLNVWEM